MKNQSDDKKALQAARQLLRQLQFDLNKNLPKKQKQNIQRLIKETQEHISREQARLRTERDDKKRNKPKVQAQKSWTNPFSKGMPKDRPDQNDRSKNSADHSSGNKRRQLPLKKNGLGKKSARNKLQQNKTAKVAPLNYGRPTKQRIPILRPRTSKARENLLKMMRQIRANMTRKGLQIQRANLLKRQSLVYRRNGIRQKILENRARRTYLANSKLRATASKSAIVIGDKGRPVLPGGYSSGDKSRPLVHGQYTALFKASESGIASGAMGALSNGLRPLGPTAFINFMTGLKQAGKSIPRGNLVDGTGNKTSNKPRGPSRLFEEIREKYRDKDKVR